MCPAWGGARLLFVLATFVVLMLAMQAGPVQAQTTPTLLQSFAGNVNFTGTSRSLRTNPNSTNACSVVANATTAAGSDATQATLSGIPSGATIRAAYLYWAGSGSSADYNITFDSTNLTASRQYTITPAASGFPFFSGVVDVTSIVTAKGNNTYSFSGLTINNGTNYCSNETVLGAWALLVIYEHVDEEFRVLNLYEGFQAFQNSSFVLNLTNFNVPSNFIKGKIGHITWEGDPTLFGGGETLSFGSTEMTDANNPSGNQFNSVSTVSGTPDTTTYGIDFDAYDLPSPVIQSGQTTASTTYVSGQDLVLLSAEIVAVPNTPVSDISLTMSRNVALSPGGTAAYTLTMTNNGPNNDSGPFTIVNTLPSGLSLSSYSGTGWTCSTSGQTVTCTRTGTLVSGASAPALILNVSVASNASGDKTNSATATGSAFDNVSGNNTATDTYSITADLAIGLTRSVALAAGGSATYTATVANLGPAAEPGPVVVTVTLDSGVSLSSHSGTGWSCVSLTCTYSGGLASGAATALSLTVAVASGTTGAITNAVSVDGAGTDTNSANDSASDTAILSAYAYYRLDESSWGTILDYSGSGRNATGVLGTAAPTGYPAASSAISGNPGTCGSASIPASASQTGINTGLSVGGMTAGTIAFWYRGNAAWNDGNIRTLFDASANNGNQNADKHFFLIKNSTGSLTFALEDSGDNDGTVSTGTNTFAANTWHHIAVTWSLTSDRMRIYVDGALAGSVSVALNNAFGTLNTLYLGTWRTSNVTGQPVTVTTNSANGLIDEFYLFNTELSATAVADLMAVSHACASPDHYQITIPTVSVNCLPTTVTVTACADSSNPCTNVYTATSGQTATLSTDNGALAGTTVVFNSSGTASTTLSYPAAANGATSTLSLNAVSLAASAGLAGTKCCKDGTNCTGACQTTFKKTGFIFSGSAGGVGLAGPQSQVAGTASGIYYLRAIRTEDSTQACEAALVGPQTVSMAYECVNPTTCYSGNNQLLGVNGSPSVSGSSFTAINGNSLNAVSSYGSVQLVFDANGNAPFSLKYRDAGSVRLTASKTVDVGHLTGVNGATLTGTSQEFHVRPYRFELSNIRNAANVAYTLATDHTSAVFTTAGTNFSVTATARTSEDEIAYNYGRETSPYGVHLTPTKGDAALYRDGALSGDFGAFSNGSATGSFSWNEVGILTLTPEVKLASAGTSGYYMTAGQVVGGLTPATGIGRFVPHHFGVDLATFRNRNDLGAIATTGSIMAGSTSLTVGSATGMVAGRWVAIAGAGASGAELMTTISSVSGTTITLASPASTTVAGAAVALTDAFTYMAEPMRLGFRVTAYNAANSATENYRGNYAKLSASLLGVAGNGTWITTGGTCATTSCMGLGAINSGTPSTALTARLNMAVAGAGAITPSNTAWADGRSTFDIALSLARPTTTTSDATWGPYDTVRIGVAPVDTDGVSLPVSGATHGPDLDADANGSNERVLLATTSVRLGRLRISNAHGTDLLTLPIGIATQFWNGNAFVTNTLDHSSILTLPADIVLDNWQPSTAPLSGITVTTPTFTFSSGSGRFVLSRPTGAVRQGSVDMSLAPGAGIAPYLPANRARARYGVPKGNDQIIHFREIF